MGGTKYKVLSISTIIREIFKQSRLSKERISTFNPWIHDTSLSTKTFFQVIINSAILKMKVWMKYIIPNIRT